MMKAGYPLPLKRFTIVSASRLSLNAATCTAKPGPDGSGAVEVATGVGGFAGGAVGCLTACGAGGVVFGAALADGGASEADAFSLSGCSEPFLSTSGNV